MPRKAGLLVTLKRQNSTNTIISSRFTFKKLFQTLSIQTQCRLPSQSFRSYLKGIHSLLFLSTPQDFIFLQRNFSNLWFSDYRETLCHSENLIETFSLMPLGKTPSQVIFIPKKRGITHPLGRIFSKICPPARKRGGDRNYGAVSEKYKIDLTNSINSPYFSN